MATMDKKTRELLDAAKAIFPDPYEDGKHARLKAATQAFDDHATRESLDWISKRMDDEQKAHWQSHQGTPYIQIYEGHWVALKEAIEYWNKRHHEGDS